MSMLTVGWVLCARLSTKQGPCSNDFIARCRVPRDARNSRKDIRLNHAFSQRRLHSAYWSIGTNDCPLNKYCGLLQRFIRYEINTKQEGEQGNLFQKAALKWNRFENTCLCWTFCVILSRKWQIFVLLLRRSVPVMESSCFPHWSTQFKCVGCLLFHFILFILLLSREKGSPEWIFVLLLRRSVPVMESSCFPHWSTQFKCVGCLLFHFILFILLLSREKGSPEWISLEHGNRGPCLA